MAKMVISVQYQGHTYVSAGFKDWFKSFSKKALLPSLALLLPGCGDLKMEVSDQPPSSDRVGQAQTDINRDLNNAKLSCRIYVNRDGTQEWEFTTKGGNRGQDNFVLRFPAKENMTNFLQPSTTVHPATYDMQQFYSELVHYFKNSDDVRSLMDTASKAYSCKTGTDLPEYTPPPGVMGIRGQVRKTGVSAEELLREVKEALLY